MSEDTSKYKKVIFKNYLKSIGEKCSDPYFQNSVSPIRINLKNTIKFEG